MQHSVLKTTLGDLLKVNTTRYPDTVRTLHLNQADRKLCAEYLMPWCEVEESVTLTIGQALYSLKVGGGLIAAGAGKLHVDLVSNLLYTDSEGEQQPIHQRTREELLGLYPLSTANAPPKQFAVWAEKLRVAPPPDTALAVTLAGRGHSQEMSADADESAWAANAPMILVYCAAEMACEYMLEPDLAVLYAKRWREEADDLDIQLAGREMEGRDNYQMEPR